MNAPLQLERYVFTKLEVEANPDYVPQETVADNPIKLRLDIGLGEHQEDPTKFQVIVGIDELRAEKGTLPYRIALQAVGLFSVSKDFKHDDLKKVVQVNGASMLYSAARELVLLITGRGPWSGYQLPTISFYQAVNEATSQQSSQPALGSESSG